MLIQIFFFPRPRVKAADIVYGMESATLKMNWNKIVPTMEQQNLWPMQQVLEFWSNGAHISYQTIKMCLRAVIQIRWVN